MICCIPNWNVVFSVDDEKHMRLIEKAFSGFCFKNINCLKDIKKNNFCWIIIEENQNDYCIKYILDETLIFTDLTSKDVIFLLYELIEKYFTSLNMRNYIMLHGASMSINDTVIGLIATTRTGKSTLTTYLSNNGYSYFSDDIIIVNENTYETLRFPLPISLRSIEPLKEKMKLEISHEGYNKFRKEYTYYIENLNKKRALINEPDMRLSKIFFLNRCDKIDVEKLKISEAYIKLLHNIKYSKDFDNEISNLIRLSENIECYELFYDTLENANILIRQTFGMK